MSDDEVKIRLPRKVSKQAAKEMVAEVMDGKTAVGLQRHLHDGVTASEIGFLKAEVAYLTDPQMRPASFFYPLVSSGMKYPTYLQRVADERWEQNRDKIRAQAKSELVRRVGSQIIREQVKEAEEVNRLRGWLLDLLTPINKDDEGNFQFKVQPRSLEGVVKVFKEVSILLQMYRQTVLQQIEPHVPNVVDDEIVKGPFTDEEAGLIAEKILEKRRK